MVIAFHSKLTSDISKKILYCESCNFIIFNNLLYFYCNLIIYCPIENKEIKIKHSLITHLICEEICKEEYYQLEEYYLKEN